MKTLYPNGRKVLVDHLFKLSTYKLTIVLIAAFMFPFALFAQFFPSNPGGFGVDGDIIADQRLIGSFSGAGSHDWFKSKNSGTGMDVFDTAGAAGLKAQLSVGTNIAFSRKMQYDPYTLQHGYLMLDGTYARDYFGLSVSSATTDKTVFVSTNTKSNKNHDDPSTWTTIPGGDQVPSKSDIIDTYLHMRRVGNSVKIGNPSPLMLYFAASSLATDGERYLDFELFKTPLTYSNGTFSGAGYSATGGRAIWEFNADGSLNTFGSMSVCFSFSSQAVTEIALLIWVSYNVFANVKPTGFEFIPNEFYGASNNSGYGYAKIRPKNGGALPAWGAVNTSKVAAPAWGTSSKDEGVVTTNYYATNYGTGQFAEGAIDLTVLGVDPALVTNFDKCTPPYRKAMIKSRSSSSFSSALQDFSGPLDFLNAPVIPASITSPVVLTCTVTSQVLQPANYIIGASYKWSAAPGNITSNPDSAFAVVNQPGKYYLTSSLYEGCTPTTNSVTVLQDINKPVAKIMAMTGALTTDPKSTVQLWGGDEIASNYATPFGGSQGLEWDWIGPNGFTSIEQNPKTNTEGYYQLTVTEKRNGCQDSAGITVFKAGKYVLPIQLLAFTAEAINNKPVLQWSVANNETGNRFEVEASHDGNQFKTSGIITTTEKTGTEDYQYKDVYAIERIVYYRLKIINKNGAMAYSKVIQITPQGISTAVHLLQNPVETAVTFKVNTTSGTAIANIYSASGMKVLTKTIVCQDGLNQLQIPIETNLLSGVYILEFNKNAERQVIKFIKK